MTRVYGSATVEPGGMELDTDQYQEACPMCGELANYHTWQAAESGSINTYTSIFCPHCEHEESDGLDADDYGC